MPDPFLGYIPDTLLYDPTYNMWVRDDGSGLVTVGATAYGLYLAGEIIMFTGKPQGAEVARGRGIGTVETGKTVLAVHSPVSIFDLRCNDEAEDLPALIYRFPYEQGWLAKGVVKDWPTAIECLIDGPSYRNHILTMDPTAGFVSDPQSFR